MNKHLILVFIGMFLISLSFVSAESIGTFKQGTTINITNYCQDGGCTGIDLISIKYPNGTTEIVNQAMTMNGQEGFYEWSNTNDLGTYYYKTTGSNGITNEDSFDVTPNGKEFTTQNSISYLGYILILLFTFLLTLYGAINTKWEHLKNEQNEVLSINNLRYVKVFLFTMSYLLMMFLFGLSYKFFREADMQGFTDFFYYTYTVLQSLMYPIIIATVIIFFIIFITNKKLLNNLKLGV